MYFVVLCMRFTYVQCCCILLYCVCDFRMFSTVVFYCIVYVISDFSSADSAAALHYIHQHQIPQLFEHWTLQLLHHRPEKPVDFLIELITKNKTESQGRSENEKESLDRDTENVSSEEVKREKSTKGRY